MSFHYLSLLRQVSNRYFSKRESTIRKLRLEKKKDIYNIKISFSQFLILWFNLIS